MATTAPRSAASTADPGKVRVATRGDDLGTNPTTNRAFHEACLRGILRNVGVLVPAPYVEQAAEMLAHEKSICFGLHSAMLAEWDTMRWGPVAPREKVRSLLAPDGNFFQFGEDLYHHHPNHDELFIELQAQLDKARQLGFDIKYVDAHMGWTWILKDDIERFYRWAEKEHLVYRVPYQRLPEVKVEGDPVEKLAARLAAAPPGLYMYGGHPSYDNEEMRKLGHRGYEAPRPAQDREWERRIFTDPRIIKVVTERHIQVVRQDEV